jgi:hypothetical protein
MTYVKINENNKKLLKKESALRAKVFAMYPLLKVLHRRGVIPYDDNILDAEKVFKEGKTWVIQTPRYYNEAELSKDEVTELKRFIRDKKR